MSLYVLKTNRMKFLCELMVICASLLSCPFVRAAGPLKIVKQGNAYLLEVADSLLGRDLLFGSRVVYISRADDGGSDSSAIRVKREVFEHGTVGF